jgi:hypothetical protein
MRQYNSCFGMQTPHRIRFNDGSSIVVWATADELNDLSSLEELGHRCLFCENDYLCFELSRCRDLFIPRETRIT